MPQTMPMTPGPRRPKPAADTASTDREPRPAAPEGKALQATRVKLRSRAREILQRLAAYPSED